MAPGTAGSGDLATGAFKPPTGRYQEKREGRAVRCSL